MADEHGFDVANAALDLITADSLRRQEAGETAPITGTVVCPKCGDVIDYKVFGPRSMSSKCRTCRLRVMS